MAILEIVKYPSPILQAKAKPLDRITSETSKFLDDMFDTMYAAQGVGLAAPQVDVGLRIIVIDVSPRDGLQATAEGPSSQAKDESTGPLTFMERAEYKYEMINPIITHEEGEIEWEEGCLSIPDFRLMMKRSNIVTAEYLNREGQKKTLTASGLLAVAIQHEIDHLDGKLIIDNVSRLKRDMHLRKILKAFTKAGDK